MQNKYKLIISSTILAGIFSTLWFLPPFLNKSVKNDIENKNFKSAAKKYSIIASMSYDPIKKGGAYYISGDCYLEIKDIKHAIQAYEKAESTLELADDYSKTRLTDLYIITGNLEKATQRGAEYKICATIEDWNCALKDLNSRIENPKSATMIGSKIYAEYDLYLARAIIYRNLNNEKLANDDLKTAIMLAPDKKTDLEINFNNKNYFKDYYTHLKQVFQ